MISQMEIATTKEATQEYKKGLNPLVLYLTGSIEERGDIILNHPDVCGYIYVHDRIVTKAFLPKKVVKYDTKDEDNHYTVNPPASYQIVPGQKIIIMGNEEQLKNAKDLI